MKKNILTSLFVLCGSILYAQTSVDLTVSTGLYSCYKQIGVSYKIENYSIKAAFGFDNSSQQTEAFKKINQRLHFELGLGRYFNNTEIFVLGSLLNTLPQSKFGCTIGANYHFKHFYGGISWNTHSLKGINNYYVWDGFWFGEPTNMSKIHLPQITLGFKF